MYGLPNEDLSFGWYCSVSIIATSFLASLTRFLGEKVLSNVLEWCATSEFLRACKVEETHLNGESSGSEIE